MNNMWYKCESEKIWADIRAYKLASLANNL